MTQGQPPRLGWAWFALIRLALFAGVLTLLLLILPVEPWISAVLAAIIALCLSMIFLWGPLAKLTGGRWSRRAPDRADDDAEDAAIDGSQELRS